MPRRDERHIVQSSFRGHVAETRGIVEEGIALGIERDVLFLEPHSEGLRARALDAVAVLVVCLQGELGDLSRSKVVQIHDRIRIWITRVHD